MQTQGFSSPMASLYISEASSKLRGKLALSTSSAAWHVAVWRERRIVKTVDNRSCILEVLRKGGGSRCGLKVSVAGDVCCSIVRRFGQSEICSSYSLELSEVVADLIL